MLEKLQEKLALINNDINQIIINHNALIGAKQVLEQLIEEAKKDIIPPLINDEETH